MSTVVFDGRIFAADTQVTGLNIDHGFSKMKVLKDKDGKAHYVFQFTGNAFAFEHCIKIFLGISTELPPNAFEGGGSMYAYDVKNKKAYICAPSPTGVQTLEWLPHKPYSDGSGGAFALGAVLAGKNALEAISIASQLDPYTNDKVQCWDMSKPNDFSRLTPESVINFNDFTACDARFVFSSDFRVNYLKRSKRHKEKEERRVTPQKLPTSNAPAIQLIELQDNKHNNKFGARRPKNNR